VAGWGRCRSCRRPIWWGESPYSPGRAFPFDDEDEEQSHFETCAAQEWVTDELGERQRVSKCKACGAKVWWETTYRGRRRPMNVDGDRGTDECHFDTCAGEPVGAGARAQQEQQKQREEPRTNNGWWSDSGARGPSDVPYSIRLWLPDLELQWPCTGADVTSAFRRLALKHHPDMGGNSSDFIRIKLAYDRLKDLLGVEAHA
jgi:hypothetical protein